MTSVIASEATRQILFTGHAPSGAGPGTLLADVEDGQAAMLAQPGVKTLNEDGTITVTPPDPDAIVLPAPGPTPQQEAVDQLVSNGKAALGSASSLDEVKAVFAGALDGLGAIYGSGDTPPD